MKKKTKSARLCFRRHNLAIFYNPEYDGLHVVHEWRKATVVVGGCCHFLDDAYTNISRHEIPRSALKGWIKLKRNLNAMKNYPFMMVYQSQPSAFLTSTWRALCTKENQDSKRSSFYRSPLIIHSLQLGLTY